MNRDELRRATLDTLTDVAPEVDPASLKDSVKLRDQLDLDSMDWLRFLAALEKNLGVSVPESDYRRLLTLNDVVEYLAARKQS